MTHLTLQNIWLAGLGAMARSESGDTEWLNELIKEGKHYESLKQAELTELFKELDGWMSKPAKIIHSKSESIEQTFENKLAQTLHKLGLASKQDINDLKQRLQTMEKELGTSSHQ